MRSRNTPGAVDFNVIVRCDLPITARIALDNCSTQPSGRTILFALTDCLIDDTPLARHDAAICEGVYAVKGSVALIHLP